MSASLQKGISVLKEVIDAPIASYFNSCVHCGLCAEACLFYTETGDPKYTPIHKLEPKPGGQRSDLRSELLGFAVDEKSYPRQSNVFSGRLRRLLPVLRKKGVTVDKTHTRSGCKITVGKVTVCDD